MIPPSVKEAAAKLIEDFKNVHADLNAAIVERNEVDKQMKNATSEFFIKELEETYLDINRTVTMLRGRKVGFH